MKVNVRQFASAYSFINAWTSSGAENPRYPRPILRVRRNLSCGVKRPARTLAFRRQSNRSQINHNTTHTASRKPRRPKRSLHKPHFSPKTGSTTRRLNKPSKTIINQPFSPQNNRDNAPQIRTGLHRSRFVIQTEYSNVTQNRTGLRQSSMLFKMHF